jgi:hypothetical protein
VSFVSEPPMSDRAESESTVRGVRRPRRASGLLFLLPLIALWVIPVVIFVLLVPRAQGQEAASLQPGAVRTVTVGSRLNAATQAVDVTVTAPRAGEIASAASGLVTAVSATVGAALVNGAPLVTVDGVGVLAYVAPAPLYRDLAPGSKGADVRELSQYLSAIGLLPASAVSDSYGRAMSAGVSALQKRIGAPVDGSFRLAFVAWVPPSAAAIGQVVAGVGDRVNAGDVLVRGGAVPTGIALATAGSAHTKPDVPAGILRLSSGEAHTDFGSLTLTVSERAGVQAFLTAAVAAGGVSITTPAGATATTYSGAILSVAEPKRVAVVPSSALYATAGGTSCVFTASGGGYRAVKLGHPELLSGELGSVSVPAELAGKTVIRDPTVLPAETRATCG